MTGLPAIVLERSRRSEHPNLMTPYLLFEHESLGLRIQVINHLHQAQKSAKTLGHPRASVETLDRTSFLFAAM
jgi:hypothetical protein